MDDLHSDEAIGVLRAAACKVNVYHFMSWKFHIRDILASWCDYHSAGALS